MFEVKQHAGFGPGIALVHQYGSSAQQIAMALQRQVDGGIQQRMTWADKSSKRLALYRNQRLLEGDPLIPGKNGFTDPD